MVQYVDAKTAMHGHVRKVVLVHMVPAETPGHVLVSIDVVEHLVADRGLIRGRRGPRVTRKIVLEEMTDDAARRAGEDIARAEAINYICIDRDVFPPPMPIRQVHASGD